MQLRSISGWKKVLIMFTIFEMLIILADFIVAFSYGVTLRTSAGWLFGRNDIETFGSLLFFEGAILVGVGAVIAAGYSENVIVHPRRPSTAYIVEKISKDRAEFREKQISTGFLLMLLGAPLIAMTIILII
ncbi:MAG: hypothetical protein ACW99F_04465 [Candidatus Hodarchaeales archaeon]